MIEKWLMLSCKIRINSDKKRLNQFETDKFRWFQYVTKKQNYNCRYSVCISKKISCQKDHIQTVLTEFYTGLSIRRIAGWRDSNIFTLLPSIAKLLFRPICLQMVYQILLF